LITYLWIALGGALGSVARYAGTGLVDRWLGTTLPWGTILVNITGSLVIGVFAGLTAGDGRPLLAGDPRAFLMIGVCGGYTTFSSFSLQTLNLLRSGEVLLAGANILISVAACLAAVWLGYAAATALGHGRAA
jgi:CrcB protein